MSNIIMEKRTRFGMSPKEFSDALELGSDGEKDPFEPSKDELKIKDIKISFDDYFQKNNVSPEAQKKIDTTDILIIPTKTEDEKYYFAQESIEFIKFCRLNNSQKSIDILASGDIPVRSLHSFDIWMPIIWVSSKVLFKK